MLEIKVLLVDDQLDQLESFIVNAETKGLDIFEVKSLEEAKEVILNKKNHFDAVILDVRFYLEKGSTKVGQKAYQEAVSFFTTQEMKFFTFTGVKNLEYDESFRETYGFDEDDSEFFLKGKDDNRLIERIKTFVQEEAVNWKIRNEHYELFKLCSDQYLGQHTEKELITLLSIIQDDSEVNNNLEVYLFNPIRKLLEDLFKVLYRKDLIPLALVPNGQVRLGPSNRFCAGFDVDGFELNQPYFPRLIADQVKFILAVTQPASHRSSLDGHLELNTQNYLLKGVLYQLFDVLCWFKSFIDTHPQANNWKEVVSQNYKGIIEKDQFGNYHCGEFLLNKRFVYDHNKEGDEIEVTQFEKNTSPTTRKRYPYFVKYYL
ncbi:MULTISPECIES: response regulator [Flammeovirga]|uniref:Response regulator n=1 Tax=Flammeovirga agarivorans TaxID=2726742 RepID=A0A7X8SQL9_9BACT|nr:MULTISPECIES: response regulator [Flammeovirga]NLR94432.1 response regulator [Flammeovirga agarivorans]